MRILLDTSFLVNCVKFKLDFIKQLSDHELFMVASIADELNELASGGGADAKNAKVALKPISKIKSVAEPESTAGDVDASLLELSKEGYAVATQDAELKIKVKALGGTVAFIRQRKIVAVE